jgi:hypothetical protein
MAALVKTSNNLAAGGLTLLRQEISVQSASEITLNAEYICLPSYADTWTQRLRVGAPTPLPAPTAIGYYNLLSPLALASVSQNISQGLCYFSCTFSAPRDATTPVDGSNPTAPQFETTVTSTVQEQSLSGSYSYITTRWEYNRDTKWNQIDTTQTRNWAFEYDSETKTVTASSEQLVAGDPLLIIDPDQLYISPPRWKTVPLSTTTRFFIAGPPVMGRTNVGRETYFEGLNAYYRIDTITRKESTVSSNGQRRFSVTLQKVYEVIPASFA